MVASATLRVLQEQTNGAGVCRMREALNVGKVNFQLDRPQYSLRANRLQAEDFALFQDLFA